MAQHRNSISVQIKAQDHAILSQFAMDKYLRVMVFCATQNTGYQDIAFPHQSELKVNGDDVKANLRGLKNKPGSTRPVDITDMLRLNIRGYPNKIEFTYALTTKAGDKASQITSQVRRDLSSPNVQAPRIWANNHSSLQRFYLVVNICRTVPVERLVQGISTKKISKASVVLEREFYVLQVHIFTY